MKNNPDYLTQIAIDQDADVYVISSAIDYNSADSLLFLIKRTSNRRTNCILLLTTNGGDPDAAYRMVRAIKNYYKSFILYVFGICKSAGTLVALGADEIVMSDFGEFGPLDIQLPKDDESANISGLSYLQSLASLNEQMKNFFIESFFAIRRESENTISIKTAADIAAKLAIGLVAPISGQMDPIKLGEVEREMKIAEAYAERLTNSSKSINKLESIKKLVAGYPSHTFVIDYNEAVSIFPNVRKPDENELKLEQATFEFVRQEKRIIDTLISSSHYWGKSVETDEQNSQRESEFPSQEQGDGGGQEGQPV